MQLSCSKALFLFLPLGLAGQTATDALSVTLRDGTGAAVSGAEVHLRSKATGKEQTRVTEGGAPALFEGVPAGTFRITTDARGFAPITRDVSCLPTCPEITLQLEPATLAQSVLVSDGQILDSSVELERLPGSASMVTASQLTGSRAFTTDEALRKVPGIQARSEEGFSLRPNIGIRGLNPTRSTKVLLLEDGLPLSYAPYGDNASYYHPPVDRFEQIEVIKGGGQILFGPMTVGGVVNYITPAIPTRREGFLTLVGGNRDYFNGHAQYGFNLGRTGILLDTVRKQGEGARDNVRSGLSDFGAKTLTTLTPRQTLGLRFSFYDEDSRVTYSGLRQDEWNQFGARYNPFRNDAFNSDRMGLAATHSWAMSNDFVMTTRAYGYVFERNWWRQSSNSAQRPNDSADPVCGSMLNLNTTCGNEGRLRKYYTWGVEPRFRAGHRLFGVRSETDFGVRYHDELQERIQANGALPVSRLGVIVENNQRIARAGSGFVQNRFLFGKFTATVGVRLERVHLNRTNRLANGGAGVFGRRTITQAIPGVGLSYAPDNRVTLFTGVHRGFAPPRVEDVVNNNTGASVDLDSELSWNYEAGARVRVRQDFSLEGAFFRMNFSNQVVASSVAGGVGAALTNGGRTLHQGVEIGAKLARRNLFQTSHGLALHMAYTYLPDSSFVGTRFSSVGGFTNVLITGNRLPYAPRNLLTSSLHYSHARGATAMIEAVVTSRQFGDDLNTVNGTPDGQRGVIPGNTIWNATVNYPIEVWHTTAFVSVKNLFDRLYIADRTRGLLPGTPRLVQAGLRFSF